MNSIEYQETIGGILDHYRAQLDGKPMIFQQDNTKIHASRSTRQWFAAQNIPLLDSKT
jgi:hypothetical protein